MVENMENSILAAIGSGIALDLYSARLGELEAGSGGDHRSCGKRKCSRNVWNFIWIWRSCRRRRGNLGNTLRGDDAGCGVFIPCI